MDIDWAVMKADYFLHHELSLRALAEQYGVPYGDLSGVAAEQQWSEERASRGTRIAEKAMVAAEINQVEELASFNSDCLRQAKVFVSKISFVLNRHDKPHELKALASAFESTQRIGRLCLGAAVETVQTIPAEFDVDSAQRRLFDAMVRDEAEEGAVAGEPQPVESVE